MSGPAHVGDGLEKAARFRFGLLAAQLSAPAQTTADEHTEETEGAESPAGGHHHTTPAAQGMEARRRPLPPPVGKSIAELAMRMALDDVVRERVALLAPQALPMGPLGSGNSGALPPRLLGSVSDAELASALGPADGSTDPGTPSLSSWCEVGHQQTPQRTEDPWEYFDPRTGLPTQATTPTSSAAFSVVSYSPCVANSPVRRGPPLGGLPVSAAHNSGICSSDGAAATPPLRPFVPAPNIYPIGPRNSNTSSIHNHNPRPGTVPTRCEPATGQEDGGGGGTEAESDDEGGPTVFHALSSAASSFAGWVTDLVDAMLLAHAGDAAAAPNTTASTDTQTQGGPRGPAHSPSGTANTGTAPDATDAVFDEELRRFTTVAAYVANAAVLVAVMHRLPVGAVMNHVAVVLQQAWGTWWDLHTPSRAPVTPHPPRHVHASSPPPL